MPKPKSHIANSPLTIAEAIQDKLETVPGDRTCFLKYRRKGESFALETYLCNSPECDRLRAPSASSYDIRFIELGTYRKGVATREIVEDISETMARVK